MRYSLGHRVLCAGERGCASQQRINMSVVPVAPQVSLEPLSSCLAYPGFSEQCGQCEQQDNWHCEQDEKQYNWHGLQDTQWIEEPDASQKKSWQDTQWVGEPEVPLKGGSQWPAYRMWYFVKQPNQKMGQRTK